MKTKSLTQRLLAMLIAVMMVFSAVPAALLLSADAATSTTSSTSAKKLSKAKVTVTTPVKYTGKAKKPTVKVTYGKKTLKEGKHYTVKYYNNKEVGYAKVKVSAIKKSGYTGSKTAKFRIQPAKVGGLKVTKTAQTYIKLAWSAVKGATGYVVYRYNPSTDTYTRLKAVKKLSAIATKLTAGTTYRFAVRAYTRVDDRNFFGTYSKVRKAATAAIPVPTTAPTTQPTTEPTTQPTTEPSTQPSTEPSTQPSTEPSTQPSTEPSTQLSTEPSTQPSTEPTTQTLVPLSTGPVTGLKAKKSADKVVLTWDAMAGATGYEVYSYDSVSGKYNQLQSVTAPTATISGLKKQQPTTFAVLAVQKTADKTTYSAYSDKVDETVYFVDYYADIFKNGPYTVELKIITDDDLGMDKMTLASKNGNINMQTTIKDDSLGNMDAEMRYIKAKDKLYVHAMGMWIDGKGILGDDDAAMLEQMNIFGTLELDDLDNVQLSAERIGTTMYTVETVSGKNSTTKFYYSGDALKRIVITGGGIDTTMEILSFSPSAKDSLFTEPVGAIDISTLM